MLFPLAPIVWRSGHAALLFRKNRANLRRKMGIKSNCAPCYPPFGGSNFAQLASDGIHIRILTIMLRRQMPAAFAKSR